MPHQPPEPGDVPNVQPAPLSAEDRKRFSTWVDPKVIDDPEFDLLTLLGAMQAAYRHAHVTPKDIAEGYKRAIERLRREERTGIRDDEIRMWLQNPFCVDHVSYPDLASLAANAGVSASELRQAIEASLERTIAWPQGKRFNPAWEGVRMAVSMASAWYATAGRPELRANKAAQRGFILAALDRAGLPTQGLRQHPKRLDRDEVLGPSLERLLALGRPLHSHVVK
jgi:hypothetical protein